MTDSRKPEPPHSTGDEQAGLGLEHAGAGDKATSGNGHDLMTAADFLERLRPGGPWVLTAIHPTEEKIKTITAVDADAIHKFVRAHDGKMNLYFSVNPTRTAMTSKASKTDIAAVEYLLSDLDPRPGETSEAAKTRYLAALTTYQPAPNAIIDSGNGIQVLWQLAEPIRLPPPIAMVNRAPLLAPEAAEIIDDVESRIKATMATLGSVAGTQNIDRILRLPWTTNLPNAKKIREGRVACPTKLIYFKGDGCTLEAFPKSSQERAEQPDSADTDIDTLPVSGRIKNLIRGIDDAEHVYTSRSERVNAVIWAMTSAGCTDDQIEAIFSDRSLRISAHVLEQAHPQQYLAKHIAKARKATVDPNIAKLNETYALVTTGDKNVIMKISVTDKGDIRFLTLTAFEQWFYNRFVTIGDKSIPLGKYWLHHPQRRQFEGLTFSPHHEVNNHFNLWQGFAVKPKPGDCSKFLAHIHDNICRGDSALSNWVVGWFAQIVQHPNVKMGTSLVLRGPQGTGKTKVGQVFGSLFGVHYVPVSDPRYITGRFNSHLFSCLLLHCDEAFWAGDRSSEGKLKDLVTGDLHFIEFKGKEAIRLRNYVRMLVSGNPDWLVPAGFDERRFATLDVGEDKMRDAKYFAAIDAEMDNGGREALLDYLLKFDLSTVNLRDIPKTAALLDQKIASLSAEQGWWLDVLTRGELPWGCDQSGHCPVFRLFNRYLRHAISQGIKRRSIETKLGMFLTKYVPGLHKLDTTYKRWAKTESRMVDQRGYIYEFPPLAACRETFTKVMQQAMTWDGPQAWVSEPPPDAGEAEDDSIPF